MKISFQKVSKKYGIIHAIKDISFEIKTGEFVFITGNSGAGKTTLLKLLLNQIQPSSGKILIDDVAISEVNKKTIDQIRRKIGVIFQNYQLIPDKSVEENILLNLDIIGVPEKQRLSRVETVLKLVNLSPRRYLFPSQLSAGELQRASLARALSVEPKLILADEPTGNLDIENAWNLLKLLKKINKENNTTIIMTTHNQDIINSLNNRIIILKNGELVKDSKNKK
jgi:cell division transport system ATP-binding protein